MQTMRWNKLRLFYAFSSILIIWLALKSRSYRHVSDGLLKNTKANEVWEFMADFSNMRTLLPDLKDFQIISEAGNFDHWRYAVKYYEKSLEWPYLESVGSGNYSVRRDGATVNVVSSTHSTCFFMEMFCLSSNSEFRVWQDGKHSKYKELIDYECPWILRNYCYNLTANQRRTVLDNLREYFKDGVRK